MITSINFNKMNKNSNTKGQQAETGFQEFKQNASDYYETLGVDRKATPEQISVAYKRLSLRSHPDQYRKSTQSQEADVNFQHISEAYQALADPERRVK
jgi:DnaJ-class molecular chaperone